MAMKQLKHNLIVLAIFSIAMGFLESAVVVYIREIYYPNGFEFPLVPFDKEILVTELLREVTTLVMLISISVISGKDFNQRFAMFLYSFGIWDIFYYVFLKLLVDWPASLLTWDILFLIPVPWIGPVLAPFLLSLTMITLALMVLFLSEKYYKVRFSMIDWFLLVTGSLAILGSFTVDYFSIIFNSNSGENAKSIMENIQQFLPTKFNWYVFFIGWFLILVDIQHIYQRSKKSRI